MYNKQIANERITSSSKLSCHQEFLNNIAHRVDDLEGFYEFMMTASEKTIIDWIEDAELRDEDDK